MAAIRMSAWRVMAGSPVVCEWQTVTVALAHGLLLHGQQGDGLADEQAAAENNDVTARELDAGTGEEFHDAGGRAGNETGLVLLRNFAEIDGAQPVDVLGRGDAAEDGEFIKVRGQRGLDEDAVHRGIGVQAVDQREQLLRGNRRGRQEHAARRCRSPRRSSPFV